MHLEAGMVAHFPLGKLNPVPQRDILGRMSRILTAIPMPRNNPCRKAFTQEGILGALALLRFFFW